LKYLYDGVAIDTMTDQ